jgi:hypothetical protein
MAKYTTETVVLELANTWEWYSMIENKRKDLGLGYPTQKPYEEKAFRRFRSFIRAVSPSKSSSINFTEIASDWLED